MHANLQQGTSVFSSLSNLNGLPSWHKVHYATSFASPNMAILQVRHEQMLPCILLQSVLIECKSNTVACYALRSIAVVG